MVVDDITANRWLLESLLDEQGYDVIEASGYPDMVTALESKRPAMILLDYMMPGEDGIEICHILKNDEQLESIPIVIVSAVDDEDTIRQGLEAGAVAWLSKPVDDETILDHVRAAVPPS